MVFFDSHCHLQDADFAADRKAVFERARLAGVQYFMLPASTLEDSATALELALSEENCYSAIGLHPHEAKDWAENTAEELEKIYLRAKRLASDSGSLLKIRAYGEIGLDYYYDHSPREVQKQVFRTQLELAHELDLPVIIHEREAFLDCYTILKQAKADGLLQKTAGVAHCFSGSAESALLLKDLGFMLGFDGPITYHNARRALEVIRRVDESDLVIETDSPYLSPSPFRGQRNESARIPLIALKMAEIRACSLERVAEFTTANAKRLFRID
ncbi:MAG: TatD family hydrolase [Eubacteriales bacterium]|nr:TatD family hydrolase [Eubacteriales bacterium]